MEHLLYVANSLGETGGELVEVVVHLMPLGGVKLQTL